MLKGKSRTRGLVLLAIGALTMSVGVNMHAAMNINFLQELLGATTWQQGYLESFREIGGILSFFVVALFAGRSEPRIASAMLLLMGAGLAAYVRLHTVTQVMLVSLAWSIGFHAWAPLSSSLTLALSRKGREGQTIGTLGSAGSAGVLLALGGVWLLRTQAGMGMRELFLIAGGVTALGALPLLFIRDIRAENMGIPVRSFLDPRYRLYLTLELVDGMRKQIFILFAVLFMVKEYSVKVETVAALMLVNQVVNFFLAPLAGRFVDRVGEKRSLTLYFSGLIAVFLMYTALKDIRALFAVYIIDSALWQLRIGVTTYANRIAGPGERTCLLSMGITVNHLGAVSMPLVGGALYATMGYRFPFYCGALIALASIFIARRVPPKKQQ